MAATNDPIAVTIIDATPPIPRWSHLWNGRVIKARQAAASVSPITCCRRATNTAAARAITPTTTTPANDPALTSGRWSAPDVEGTVRGNAACELTTAGSAVAAHHPHES